MTEACFLKTAFAYNSIRPISDIETKFCKAFLRFSKVFRLSKNIFIWAFSHKAQIKEWPYCCKVSLIPWKTSERVLNAFWFVLFFRKRTRLIMKKAFLTKISRHFLNVLILLVFVHMRNKLPIFSIFQSKKTWGCSFRRLFFYLISQNI